MKKLAIILSIVLFASCEKEYTTPMKEKETNNKVAHAADISGTWNLITDHFLATKTQIKIQNIDGNWMLNKTIPIILVDYDEFKSVDPQLMIVGKMDGNTMHYQENIPMHGIIHLDYSR